MGSKVGRPKVFVERDFAAVPRCRGKIQVSIVVHVDSNDISEPIKDSLLHDELPRAKHSRSVVGKEVEIVELVVAGGDDNVGVPVAVHVFHVETRSGLYALQGERVGRSKGPVPIDVLVVPYGVKPCGGQIDVPISVHICRHQTEDSKGTGGDNLVGSKRPAEVGVPKDTSVPVVARSQVDGPVSVEVGCDQHNGPIGRQRDHDLGAKGSFPVQVLVPRDLVVVVGRRD